MKGTPSRTHSLLRMRKATVRIKVRTKRQKRPFARSGIVGEKIIINKRPEKYFCVFVYEVLEQLAEDNHIGNFQRHVLVRNRLRGFLLGAVRK
jgi:hypothetical protein